jgi:hypothetical protein
VSGTLPLRAVTEVEFVGRVGLEVALRLAQLLRQRRRDEGPGRYQVDCSAVSGFSEPALVELGLLAEEMRDRGSALVLANGRWKSPEPWEWPSNISISARR